jgi:hypothetical protein
VTDGTTVLPETDLLIIETHAIVIVISVEKGINRDDHLDLLHLVGRGVEQAEVSRAIGELEGI